VAKQAVLYKNTMLAKTALWISIRDACGDKDAQ